MNDIKNSQMWNTDYCKQTNFLQSDTVCWIELVDFISAENDFWNGQYHPSSDIYQECYLQIIFGFIQQTLESTP